MIPWENGKIEYTEIEAASLLGISVYDLRCLVRECITKGDTDGDGDAPLPMFRQTDILLLKMLAAQKVVA